MRHRAPYQERLPFGDLEALATRGQAMNVVGQFFEHLTGRLVSGARCGYCGAPGENPDVVTANGVVFESKASARARWLLETRQLDVMAAHPRASYVLWSYAPFRRADFPTFERLREHVARTVRRAVVLPAASVRAGIESNGSVPLVKAGDTWARENAYYALRESDVRTLVAAAPVVQRYALHPGRVQGTYPGGFAVEWVAA